MKQASYDKDRDYDAILDRLLSHIKFLITKKDDDFLILCAGDTGTGKSMLMMHALDKFMGEYKSVDYVGLTRGSFATGFKKAQSVPRGFKFLGNDEANISKREALTQYNRDLLDLYYSCRGLNIFHWWNNPSVDMIDKPFIKDRVKGFILITTKDMDRPRVYYYFTKNALVKIFEKYKDLDIKTIRKVRKKYALFKGWFKDYNGSLRKDYLDKKNPRMVEKVDFFVGKYGDREKDGTLSRRVVGELTGYKQGYIATLIRTGVIPAEFVVKLNPEEPAFLKEEVVPFLLEKKKESKMKARNNLELGRKRKKEAALRRRVEG